MRNYIQTHTYEWTLDKLYAEADETFWELCAVERCARRVVVNHVRPHQLRTRRASYNANSASCEVLIGIPIWGNTCDELLCIDDADGRQIRWMKLYHTKRRVAAKNIRVHTMSENQQKKTKVPPKLRNHALKSMCHNKGAVTKKSCHIKLELGVWAIENNLQIRAYQLVCCFRSYKITDKSKAKNREFSAWE